MTSRFAAAATATIFSTPLSESLSYQCGMTIEWNGNVSLGPPASKNIYGPLHCQIPVLITFMATRPKLGHCPEDKSIEGKEWYYPPDRPEMAICKPCYEDRIKHLMLGNRFSLNTPQGPATCDHNLWYVRRMLKAHAMHNNWAAFVAAFWKRMQLPACPRAQVISTPDRTWFWSSRVSPGFLIWRHAIGTTSTSHRRVCHSKPLAWILHNKRHAP
ncbi:hypothetical protein AUP68_10305 [Ilyonectria robusta]